MKRVILIPLVMSSVLVGCQDQAQISSKEAIEAKAQIPQWVGDYQGTTPCMGCLSRCEDCPGMAVDVELKDDMTYVLKRESLSGHNEIETLQGKIVFKDSAQTKLELLNVQTRNQLFVDLENKMLEIRVDKTAEPYQEQNDFLLEQI